MNHPIATYIPEQAIDSSDIYILLSYHDQLFNDNNFSAHGALIIYNFVFYHSHKVLMHFANLNTLNKTVKHFI